MTIDFGQLLRGGEGAPLKIFDPVIRSLEDLSIFPFLLESIYREAGTLDERELDRLRFALLRLQVYADIHRNEDLEQAQNTKYIAQVLEKIIFGDLMLEKEQYQD